MKLFCVEEGDVVSRKGFCRVGWRLQYLTHVRALCPLILDHMAPNQTQLYILGMLCGWPGPRMLNPVWAHSQSNTSHLKRRWAHLEAFQTPRE